MVFLFNFKIQLFPSIPTDYLNPEYVAFEERWQNLRLKKF